MSLSSPWPNAVARVLSRAPVSHVSLSDVYVHEAWSSRVANRPDDQFVELVRDGRHGEPLVVARMPAWMQARGASERALLLVAGVRHVRALARVGWGGAPARVLGPSIHERLGLAMALVASLADRARISPHARACFFDELFALGASPAETASMTGYAVKTVQNYLRALHHAAPEIVLAWERGEVSISVIQHWMSKPVPEQLAQWRQYQQRRAAKQQRKSKPPPRLSRQLCAHMLRAIELGKTGYRMWELRALEDVLRYLVGELNADEPNIGIEWPR